jgi:PAS domain S-box-containing protein
LPLILAVDDEKSGLHFRKLILEHAGYSVLSADDVDGALQLFRAHPIDLVITDHLLGRKTGTEMSAQMKRLKPTVPIVLLSGTHGVPEPLEHADAFLSKTEGPEQMLETIQRLLHQRAAVETPHSVQNVESIPLPMLLAAIVEDSEDPILSKTLEGKILTWNKAAERVYGYRAEEVIGKNVTMLLAPDQLDEEKNLLQRLRNGEKVEHFETVRRTKDGRVLNVSLTISPVRDADGKIIAASTITRDMTQTRRAEEALRNSERLAVAGRMAATIAHEINNPLETVTNILYLLSRNSSLDEAARGYVKIADEEVRRVGQITRTTLGLYRERDTTVTSLNIIEMLDTILMLYQRRLLSVGAELEKRYPPVAHVSGISGELRQVFSNLIANAIDALETSGSKLMVQVREGTDWSTLRRGIKVTIADNGPGMPPEVRDNLFQPFYTTKGQKGTGVGLWVSKGIIAKHAGTVHVKSKIGSGTCFTVFLPKAS